MNSTCLTSILSVKKSMQAQELFLLVVGRNNGSSEVVHNSKHDQEIMQSFLFIWLKGCEMRTGDNAGMQTSIKHSIKTKLVSGGTSSLLSAVK